MNHIRTGNHAQLMRFLRNCDRALLTPMIWGPFAIGKSAVVYRYGREKAARMNREFLIWHELSPERRIEIFENQEVLEKVFVLYDNRAASNDSTDDKGIPNINNERYLDWIQNLVYNVFSRKGAAGLLFNDEINLAPTLVQNSMYKMVYDRAVGDLAFVDDIFIVCAGNRIEDRAFVQETPWPLRTRLMHFVLTIAHPDEQTTYFLEHGLDLRLLTFFKAHEDLMFYCKEDTAEYTGSTPRTIEMLSDAIKPLNYDNDLDREDIVLLACGAVSTYVGEMFDKFMLATSKVNIAQIIRDPSKAAQYQDLDSQYGIVTLLVNRFDRDSEFIPLFGQIIEIYRHIPEEVGILLFRLLKTTRGDRFQKGVAAFPAVRKTLVNIAKYILEEAV